MGTDNSIMASPGGNLGLPLCVIYESWNVVKLGRLKAWVTFRDLKIVSALSPREACADETTCQTLRAGTPPDEGMLAQLMGQRAQPTRAPRPGVTVPDSDQRHTNRENRDVRRKAGRPRLMVC